jgi:predicted transcriptional regulator of viral defense system
MKPGEARAAIAQLAADQWGLLTAAQATAVGVTRMMLTRMTATGELERVIYGVYATSAALADELLDKRALWLSLDPSRTAEERLTRRHEAGVLSHATAAALHGIGDILDDRVEVTMPQRQQTRREELRLHKAVLRPDEVTSADGLPVTTPPRTIADLVVAGHDRDHVATALADAVRRDLTTLEEVRVALDEGLGPSRSPEVFDELRASAGLDEVALESLVVNSPVGQRVIAEVARRVLEDLGHTPAMQELAERLREQYATSLAAIAANPRWAQSVSPLTDIDIGALYQGLMATGLQDSLRRISQTYATSVPNTTELWRAIQAPPPKPPDIYAHSHNDSADEHERDEKEEQTP